jgi:hypothetical protein
VNTHRNRLLLALAALLTLVALVTFILANVVCGCPSPLWARDRYLVDGALLGSKCQATVDGHPFAGNLPGPGDIRLLVDSSDASYRVTTVVCRGLVLEFDTSGEGPPSPGRYHLANRGAGGDTTATLEVAYSSYVTAGRWPFARTGVHLEAREGYLQLEAITGGTARGTFHAVMRREANSSLGP